MSWRQSTFLLPSLIALLGMAGLFAALLGDGWWDTLAWLGLGAQAGLGLWPLLPGRGGRAGSERIIPRRQQP
ncbi:MULTISPECIES: hypothetical protein [Pseudomonadaceae]|uniref:hypothetical protein n=1 Tax=Pseudomonadaceae TaxID=135621 RepID=UPI00103D86DA|nr:MULTISPECIES: hypothetical protein [Pseudomonadaceae]MBA1276549.1 hypothetical protein [Stutzerimonas stutzeri]MBC8649056.1 hypothetical protein [Pseudomonas sp. MT4]QXY93016.1 hypothetical protein GYM54_16135 [Pseudomonas sp. MTM4]TCD22682.1 hypothetical protein E0D86_08515 [Pseudomonas sp. IC_126]